MLTAPVLTSPGSKGIPGISSVPGICSVKTIHWLLSMDWHPMPWIFKGDWHYLNSVQCSPLGNTASVSSVSLLSACIPHFYVHRGSWRRLNYSQLSNWNILRILSNFKPIKFLVLLVQLSSLRWSETYNNKFRNYILQQSYFVRLSSDLSRIPPYLASYIPSARFSSSALYFPGCFVFLSLFKWQELLARLSAGVRLS